MHYTTGTYVSAEQKLVEELQTDEHKHLSRAQLQNLGVHAGENMSRVQRNACTRDHFCYHLSMQQIQLRCGRH